MSPKLRISALVFSAAFLTTCGGSTVEDIQVFDVEYSADTVVIDESEAMDLLMTTPGPDTLIYDYDPSASSIANLQPGDLVVLSGVAYREVVSVTDLGTSIQLETDRTTLPEVIPDGTIEWNLPTSIESADVVPFMGITYGGTPLRPVASALSGAIDYSGTLGAYDVSVTLTPNGGGVDLSFNVSREIGGETDVAIAGSGSLSGFRTSGRIRTEGGATVEFETGAQDMAGNLEINAVAVNTGESQDLLSVPLGIDFPVQIGPVPLIVRLKANVNVTLILQASQSSAEANVTFSYRASQGFSVAGGASLSPAGSLGSSSFGGLTGGSAAIVAAGMTGCVEFPRLEVAMRGEFASVGLSQNNCASTVFTFDPACNEVKGTITGIALGSLGFFGITLAEGQVELYKEEQRNTAGNCD